ncbi:MAG: hypothetical protein FWD57_05970, partial [Polyangiaceae bacterium]|nr:hypothetical protein [Polyangiaceae bacterium]
LVGMLRGSERIIVRVGSSETVFSVRTEFVYEHSRQADEAGEILKQMRDSLLVSGDAWLVGIGQSAHATVDGGVLTADFEIPRN